MTIFDEIYESNAWTNGSGPGSHPAACRELISYLNDFITSKAISSIVDFGCGDWQFMSRVNLRGIRYTGYDVVEAVLQKNRKVSNERNISFLRTPSDLSELAGADLLILKDVLIHIPNDYVSALMMQREKYKYVLAINNWCADDRRYNTEIGHGEFRPIDLSAPPFSLDCSTVLRYGESHMLDPRLPRIVSRALRRYIWPGEKHVQLIVSSGAGSSPQS